MKIVLNGFIILIMLSGSLQAQCDFKVNETSSTGIKHVVTNFEWLSEKGVVASFGITSFYDGTPHFNISVCFPGDEHFFIDKEHEVTFHFKEGKPIKKNNYIKRGSKKSKYGVERCNVYAIPIDDELRTRFMKEKKECALTKLEFTHSLGQEEVKIKKKYSNVIGNQVKCIYELSMDWPEK
jgi:hypothetical protein